MALMDALHATLLLVDVLSTLAQALGGSRLRLCHLDLTRVTDANLSLNRVAVVLKVDLCLALLLTCLTLGITGFLPLLFILIVKCLLDQELLAIIKLQLIVVRVGSLVLRRLILRLNEIIERFLGLGSPLIEIVKHILVRLLFTLGL